MHQLPPSRRPPRGVRCRETGPQCATRPPCGPAAGGLDDGVDGDTGMVVSRTPGRSHLHGGGQPTVVSHGQRKPGTLRDTPTARLTGTRHCFPLFFVPVLNTYLPYLFCLTYCTAEGTGQPVRTSTASVLRHANTPRRGLECPCPCQPQGHTTLGHGCRPSPEFT